MVHCRKIWTFSKIVLKVITYFCHYHSISVCFPSSFKHWRTPAHRFFQPFFQALALSVKEWRCKICVNFRGIGWEKETINYFRFLALGDDQKMTKHRSLPLLAKNRRSYKSFHQGAIKSASTVALFFSYLFSEKTNFLFYRPSTWTALSWHRRPVHGHFSTRFITSFSFFIEESILFIFITSTATAPPPFLRGQPETTKQKKSCPK